MYQHLTMQVSRAVLGCALALVGSIAWADGRSELAACHEALNRRDYRAAYGHCSQALLSLDLPKSAYPLALRMRASAHYGLGQFDLAIKDNDEAIKLDPQNASSFHDRGFAHYGKGAHERLEVEYDRAISDFDIAIRLEPQNAWHYWARGIAYLAKRDAASAIWDLDRAIALQPGEAIFYYDRGLGYEQKGDLGQAIQDFSEAISLKPDIAEAYLHRGNAYRTLGDEIRSRQDHDRAIQLKPSLGEPG